MAGERAIKYIKLYLADAYIEYYIIEYKFCRLNRQEIKNGKAKFR